MSDDCLVKVEDLINKSNCFLREKKTLRGRLIHWTMVMMWVKCMENMPGENLSFQKDLKDIISKILKKDYVSNCFSKNVFFW